MLFENLIGNDLVKIQLRKALEANKIANTLLFAGPDGIGKSLFATALAAKLMYPQGAVPEVLKKIESSNHSDLHVFYPEGKTGSHSIASMRLLIEDVFMAPFEAEAKVFIVHDAERMLPSSSNALLKTLEEPTLDSYIILLTSKPENLLPTIVSRSSKVTFRAIPEEEIVRILQEKWQRSPLEAKQIAALSHGSLSRAFELASHPDTKEKRRLLIKILSGENINSYVNLVEHLSALDELYSKEVLASDESPAKWHKEVDSLLSQILMWYRDLHLLKLGEDPSFLYFSDVAPLLQQQDLTDLPSQEKLHTLIEETKFAIDRNMKLKTCLENFFLQIHLI